MERPDTVTINAWTGPEGEPSGKLSEQAETWAVHRKSPPVARLLVAPEPVDLRNWRHPSVGWGLILPENEAVSEQDRAVAADAPAVIQELVAARGQAPVLRYRPDLHTRFLRRYYRHRPPQDIAVNSGAPQGTGEGCLPRYLLICGSPEAVPWSLQYVLNSAAFVGRLDLDEVGLQRYVRALMNDWRDAEGRADHPVVWATDHGRSDITWLMHRAIAAPVASKPAADSDIGAKLRTLTGREATAEALTQALAAQRPGLIVTTSHGMTGPLGDSDLMARQLGLPVGNDHRLLSPDLLLSRWQPDGALWYAHACCSAGSDAETRFKGLVANGSSVDRTLAAVAALGASVAPLPKRLLGAERPLRAFIGHVEPTFDWTLRQPETGQVLTASIQTALYDRMYRKQPETVGMALEACYRHVGDLLAQWEQSLRDVARAVPEAALAALRSQLMALDRQSMVILGDPTTCLPPLQP